MEGAWGVVLRSEVAVHAAVCGVLWCKSGRSKVRNHHSQTYLTEHCFPFHCTLTSTPTPETMPVVSLLQNVICALHNVP